MTTTLLEGDCLDVMRTMELNSIDTIITDPPYGLEFMGQGWDDGVPGAAYWEAALAVAKPGAMLLCFGGTRTWHRMACAIEDAGWEIRDTLMWLYGSGFPKSYNIAKGIDKAAGAERLVIGTKRTRELPNDVPFGQGLISSHADKLTGRRTNAQVEIDITAPSTDLAKLWDGWGTALKPAWEPIILAMKPCDGPYVQNAQQHGVAGLNIDGCRIEGVKGVPASPRRAEQGAAYGELGNDPGTGSGWDPNVGRWPANVILDEEAGELLDVQTGAVSGGDKRGKCSGKRPGGFGDVGHETGDGEPNARVYADNGGPSRFFYCAKAAKKERGVGNNHPTVKPIALMRYLGRLTKTPTGGVVLDPFAGSGTTGIACELEGRDCVLIEREAEYCQIIRSRLTTATPSIAA